MSHRVVQVTIPRANLSYPIVIGAGSIGLLADYINLDEYSSIFIIADKTLDSSLAQALQDSVPKQAHTINIVGNESEKHLETVQTIWQQMFDLGADRKSLVLNLGGGVVGDMGGFAASTYMRGIDFVQIPTTVLAAADASIGGKTGCNFAGHKNIIGVFAQPAAVIIDIDSFKSLNKRLFNEGLVEIIKHAAITDDEFFQWLEDKLPGLSDAEMIEMIEKSCKIKAKIVSEDETESSSRKLLNFGHTAGHALESMSHETDTPLLHGEAVGLGMIIEARLGEMAGITVEGTSERITNILKQIEMPVSYGDINKGQFSEKLARDKKNIGNQINWTLLVSIGQALINQKINPELISNSLQESV